MSAGTDRGKTGQSHTGALMGFEDGAFREDLTSPPAGRHKRRQSPAVPAAPDVQHVVIGQIGKPDVRLRQPTPDMLPIDPLEESVGSFTLVPPISVELRLTVKAVGGRPHLSDIGQTAIEVSPHGPQEREDIFLWGSIIEGEGVKGVS